MRRPFDRPILTEHDGEPIPGLPQTLPPGERILWQGQPRWRALAIHALHVRAVGLYGIVLAAWGAVSAMAEGEAAGAAILGSLWLLGAGLGPMLLLGVFARLSGRMTLYTITNRRVVFRIGVALPVTLNIPFAAVASASLRRHADGTGDIALALLPGHRIGWFVLWPHARPWRLARAEPMLRAVPDFEHAGAVLAQALAETVPGPMTAEPRAPDSSLVAA